VQVRIHAKLGLVCIVASCLLWVAVLFVPILPVSIAEKAVVVTSLIVISEVIFWLGILLAGKELAHRYRHQFNPIEWWRKLTRKR
jgi:sterol desaturase/sphingolipid hydroxylase (fatty acid hydroxylase superfamily)